MPDTKASREKQAKRRERRRRRREIEEALDRLDEPEPVEATFGVPGTLLDDHLGTVSYPAPAAALVESIRERESLDRSQRDALEHLFHELSAGTYGSPSDVREAFRDAWSTEVR